MSRTRPPSLCISLQTGMMSTSSTPRSKIPTTPITGAPFSAFATHHAAQPTRRTHFSDDELMFLPYFTWALATAFHPEQSIGGSTFLASIKRSCEPSSLHTSI